ISFEHHEPIKLVGYLMKICRVVNNLIVHLKVKDAEEELARGRLFMFKCVKKILADGMNVLGITPLLKM
ncbi:hypothetical protein H311_03195, partial [Anncaliia algerae PRA109]